MEERATCKLEFEVGITKEQVCELLSKYTAEYCIANFYPEREIGCKSVAFAVVDLPPKLLPQLYKDGAIKWIETLMSFHEPARDAAACAA
jgi:hypothetical protein